MPKEPWECPNCGEEWGNESARRDYRTGAKCSLCWGDYV